MSDHKHGSVDSAQTVKAGCGIRYDPEVLGETTGFDFSAAKRLVSEQRGDEERTLCSPDNKESEEAS